MRRQPAANFRGFIIAAVALVIAMGIFFWHRRTPTPERTPAPSTTAARQPQPTWVVEPPAPVAQIALAHAPDRSHVGLWMLEDPELPVVVADSLIGSRFPRSSRPLNPGMTDVLQPNRRYDSKAALHHKDGSVDVGLQVLLSGDKYRLIGDDTLTAALQVFKEDRAVPVEILDARASAVEPNSHRPLGIDVPMTFSGDAGGYMSMIKPRGTPLGKHQGFFDVVVTFDAGDGKPSVATLDCFYQPLEAVPARFTGDVREVLANGSLQLNVGIDVLDAGYYVIDANLFDADGQPTAMLGARQELPHGYTEIPLLVYGRVVHEQKARAPFKLTNLRGCMMLIGQDPDRRTMADGADYTTRSYAASDFTDAEYWDANKEQQIRNLIQLASQPGGPGTLHQTIGQAAAGGWKPTW